MSMQAFNNDHDNLLRNGENTILDPGAGGTLAFTNLGLAIVEVVTAAAESRVLESADAYAVGHRLIVAFKTDGGDLTITGAESNVVLTEAGQVAEFVVGVSGASNVWRLVAASGAPLDALAGVPIDVTGARDDGTALAALLTALETLGLITDSSTAT